MKLSKTANGKTTIKMSRSEWENYGRQAGWVKQAEESEAERYKRVLGPDCVPGQPLTREQKRLLENDKRKRMGDPPRKKITITPEDIKKASSMKKQSSSSILFETHPELKEYVDSNDKHSFIDYVMEHSNYGRKMAELIWNSIQEEKEASSRETQYQNI